MEELEDEKRIEEERKRMSEEYKKEKQKKEQIQVTSLTALRKESYVLKIGRTLYISSSTLCIFEPYFNYHN